MLLSLSLVIIFPEIVTYNLDAPLDVDLNTIDIQLDTGGDMGGDDPWGSEANDPWAN